MNKLLLPAALATVTLAPALALAAPVASVTGTVNVNGSVAARCQFTNGGTATINLGELSNTATSEFDHTTVDGKQATLTGWCNGSGSTMSVHADPLVNSAVTPPNASFSNHVDFTATAGANSQTTSRSSTLAGSSTPVNVGIFTGNITVTLSASASNPVPPAKLVAGAYAGDVIVTLAPST